MKASLITLLFINAVSVHEVAALKNKGPSDDNLKNMIEASLIQEADFEDQVMPQVKETTDESVKIKIVDDFVQNVMTNEDSDQQAIQEVEDSLLKESMQMLHSIEQSRQHEHKTIQKSAGNISNI